jgi:hypothetical protein
VRLERGFVCRGGGDRAAAFVDVYNVLNANPEQSC